MCPGYTYLPENKSIMDQDLQESFVRDRHRIVKKSLNPTGTAGKKFRSAGG